MRGEATQAGEGLTLLWLGTEPHAILLRALSTVGLRLAVAASLGEAQSLLSTSVFDVVVIAADDATLPGTVRAARTSLPRSWVVAVVDDAERVSEAIGAGAHDVAFRASGPDALSRWLVSCARAAVSGCDRPAALDALAHRANALVRRVATLGDENRALRALCNQDGLTGLVSRQGLDVQLRQAVHSGGRYGHPVSMLLCDVDGLARVNEELGRSEGDETLRRLAQILAGNIRGCDVAARRGDDEFAVVLPSTRGAQAVRVAERIRTRAEHELGGATRRITVSVGVAAFEPEEAKSIEAPGIDVLLEAAYRALQLAKRRGRNRTESAISFAEPAVER